MRKFRALMEELCGHSFLASAISFVNKTLDAGLVEFVGRLWIRIKRSLNFREIAR